MANNLVRQTKRPNTAMAHSKVTVEQGRTQECRNGDENDFLPVRKINFCVISFRHMPLENTLMKGVFPKTIAG